jgi:hypothetical protein
MRILSRLLGGDTMPDNQRVPRRRLPEEIVPPACPKCQIPMDLIPLVLGLGHLANRIFECRGCGEIQVAPRGPLS